MTDPELIEKKLAEVETHVRELRTLADPDRLRSDLKEERFVTHTLQLAIQAALDAASHIVSDERLGEPSTYRELFTSLERAGWFEEDLGARLRQMAGFRNVLVHGYSAVELDVVEDVLENRLDDLIDFAAAVRDRLAGGAA
jgi:uncharacterized protein YutE (UPF0331/DUF86 family)